MIVGVTGATGLVGRFVVAELQARGVAVRALGRPGGERGGFARPPQWVEGDLAGTGWHARFLHGLDGVVHAAFDHVPGRYRGGEGADLARFLDRNLHGSLHLMQSAHDAGVARFVVLSSRAACGPGRAAIADGDPLRPDTHYGACKAALEAFVSSWGRGPGWSVCALRPTGVYGVAWPFERTKWLDIVRATLAGERWPDGDRRTEVHGHDVARAVGLLLTAPDVAGQVFGCSDLEVGAGDIVRLVQQATGLAGPLPPSPSGPAPGVMRCDGLRRRGFVFGGRGLLERTVREIVATLR